MRTKHKYKVWDIVYIRLGLLWTSMTVVKWIITEAKRTIAWKYPYYSATDIWWKYIWWIIYETNMSKRPERLIKGALKAVEDNYWWYVRMYKLRKNELNKLLKEYKKKW